MKYKPKEKDVKRWKEYLANLEKEHPIKTVIKEEDKCQRNH